MVDLLQLLLGGLQSVRGRVELIGLEALVGEADSEGLVIFLYIAIASISIERSRVLRRLCHFSGLVSTNLWDVLGVRSGGVGGDGTTSNRSELTPKGRSLASRSTEEHGAANEPN